jgi:hypothetical protein
MLAAWSRPAGAQEMVEEAEVKELRWVGFQQFQEVSRVFVRTTDPVTFRVDDSKPGVVTLILENVSVSVKNHLRHLDTGYYDSPVAFIQPRLIEGTSPSVNIEIKLRQQVAFQTKQDETVVSIDFAREG